MIHQPPLRFPTVQADRSVYPAMRLKRIAAELPAGLFITSLPWSRDMGQLWKERNFLLNGAPAGVLPLGQWPGQAPGTPRRLLLMADGGNVSPREVEVGVEMKECASDAPGEQGHGWQVQMELFELSPEPDFVWERHLLRLRHGGKTTGLAMGLRTGGEVHWWEACSMRVLQETAQFMEVEMAGAIPHALTTGAQIKQYTGLQNPLLHRHNWLNGKLYLRLHSNGVFEVFAYHINSKFFDDGQDLPDTVPVIGFQNGGDQRGISSASWDGSQDTLEVGGARFDLEEVARLATSDNPGRLDQEGQFLVLQPYAGMELFGGTCAEQLKGDAFHFRAQERLVPRGMSRTLRFSGSLSQRSPRVARYIAPAWWFGLCEEFLPESLLPVSDSYDDVSEGAANWAKTYIVDRGFEDGSVPRGSGTGFAADGEERHEPGWEGEIPHAQFLRAWRTGCRTDYDAAMRSAYHFNDVAVDHAAKAVRMHGYFPEAFSVPMNRMQGPIAAYLETGDPHLLETARAVTATSYWTHKNSWPRLAVGRDACFIRSAVLLYRYFGEEFYRQMAYDACLDVAHSQRSDGAFGDQGGGTGIHQWAGYVGKPWMGLLALGGVLDYLELFPETPVLKECVLRFANWLMEERHDHDGIMGWSYQHDFAGGRTFYCPTTARLMQLPTPKLWHQDSLGRVLLWATLETGDEGYVEAWAQSRQAPLEFGDHGTSATLQFVPWVQAKLWRATWGESGVEVAPVYSGGQLPFTATVLGPDGMVPVARGTTRVSSEVRGGAGSGPVAPPVDGSAGGKVGRPQAVSARKER